MRITLSLLCLFSSVSCNIISPLWVHKSRMQAHKTQIWRKYSLLSVYLTHPFWGRKIRVLGHTDLLNFYISDALQELCRDVDSRF